MADDPKTPATPAGETGGIDVQAITKAAVEAATQAAAQAVSAAVKPIAEQVQSLASRVEQAPTAESVSKAVAEALAAHSASVQKSTERQKFIESKLKDVPAAYLSMLGDDPSKWAEQEQEIRQTLQADLAKLGVKAPDVGSTPTSSSSGQAQSPAAAIDTSKLSGVELIRLGVQQTSGQASQPASQGNAAAESSGGSGGTSGGSGGGGK